MITHIMRFALSFFINKDLVGEFISLTESTYGGDLGVLDIHVMLPSHMKEKRRLVRQRAMYHDVTYHEELRRYHDGQLKAINWLKAIDTNFTWRSIREFEHISRTRLLTLWTK